jgi:hypothetical protein
LSTTFKIIGVVITLAGVLYMYDISMSSANATIEAGRILPTPQQFWENIEDMIGGVIIMFIGFGIISINQWNERRS